MDQTLRRAMKFIAVVIVLVILSTVVFGLGFGSSYLLTSTGVLPVGSAPTPTPSPTQEAVPETTPTPVPIPTPETEDEEVFQLFWEVWRLLEENYYGDLPDMDTVTYAAIQGMLATLNDQYTAFVEPDLASIFSEDESGEFEGIGAFVSMDEEGRLEIVEPFDNSPAREAGVRAGDRIIAIDDQSVIDLTFYEAIALIRGPAGSEVTLTIEREGLSEPIEITVTRARLEIPTVKTEILENNIAYIELYEFNARATEEMEKGLEEVLAEEPRGLILDLRGNPGGWLTQALNIADLFLDDGIIARERWEGGEQEFTAGPGDIAEDVPLVVLVDRASVSASEIVAGALQDRERAILIGETTFGKSAVQSVFTLDDGSELRVTSAMWFTPNDRMIDGQGLSPDIEVPWPELEEGESLPEGVDPQLDRAIEYFSPSE